MRRPRSVTALALAVLSFTGFYLTRFVQAWLQLEFLESLPLIVPPLYFIVSGIIWTAVGLPLGLALWTGHPRAPQAARVLALLFGVYYWLDRLYLRRPLAGRSSDVFQWGLTALLLAFLFWTLSRPAAKDFFRDRRSGGTVNRKYVE